MPTVTTKSKTFNVFPYFAAGYTVSAYPVTNWPAMGRYAPTGTPMGSATTSGTVGSDGSLTLTLQTDTEYWLASNGSGSYVYIRAAGPQGPSSGEHAAQANACTAVSVPTTAGGIQIVGANNNRQELTVINDDATNVVYLALQTSDSAPTPVLNSGIRLNAAGGSWTTRTFRGSVYGIAKTGTCVVTVTEI